MNEQYLSLKEASKLTGKAPMTIRRWIKSGKIEATTIQGKYGEEYRVKIPKHLAQTPLNNVKGPTEHVKGSTDVISQLLEANKNLTEENRNLAGQLGAAQERIRNLELKLLEEPHKPLWKRIFKHH